MQYAMPFIVAMIVAMAWLPLLAKVAAKWGIVDQPGGRKVHSAPIPRVGGLAMAIGVFVAAVVAIDLQVQDRWFLGGGAVLGFLRFNTYPASVFMGDAGSQLLGFTIGVLSIRATQSFASEFSAAIPILLLAIPILDTLSVMAQRIGEGRSPFSPDKNHIHHKLLALGFGHHEAVMVIYSMQATLFVAAYFMRFESDLTILAFLTTS